MTGYPDWNYPAFNEMATWLRNTYGCEVFNPAEEFDGDSTLPWEQYMRRDIEAITKCDAVVVLQGWQNSLGATLEVAVAFAIGLKVLDQAMLPLNCAVDPREAVASLLVVDDLKADSALLEAHGLVHGNRQVDYGHPLDDFTKTATIWSAILGTPVSPEQVALCMVGVKISREVNRPKRDNRVDGAGYFETLDMVVAERKRRHKA